ncbi:squalene synthetase-like protein [Dispira parvispora]|uniref:Squalene synthetase-like protein n=1 Tax=Dispira parvispora TaxID=1520584 RepID=A0A9W8E137_9FUNG|nr:squalene synthetase-like protein [Dispira parvispora]
MENMNIESEPKTKGKGKKNKAKKSGKAPQYDSSPASDKKPNQGTPLQHVPPTKGKKGKKGKAPQGRNGSAPPKVDMRGWEEDYGGWDLLYDPTAVANVEEFSDFDIPSHGWNFNYYGDYNLDIDGSEIDDSEMDLDAALIEAFYGQYADADAILAAEEEAYLSRQWDDLLPEDYFNGRIHRQCKDSSGEAVFNQIYEGSFQAGPSNSSGLSRKGPSEPKSKFTDKQPKGKKATKRTRKFNVYHHDSRFANFVCGNKRKPLRIPHLTEMEAKWVLHLAQVYYGLLPSIEYSNNYYNAVIARCKRSRLPRDLESHSEFLETSQMYFLDPDMMDTLDMSWSEIDLGSPDIFRKAPKLDRSKPPTAGSKKPTEPHVVGGDAQALGTENVGHKLLSKMGWKPGQSLGTTGDGIREPVKAVVRTRRAGLGCG